MSAIQVSVNQIAHEWYQNNDRLTSSMTFSVSFPFDQNIYLRLPTFAETTLKAGG